MKQSEQNQSISALFEFDVCFIQIFLMQIRCSEISNWIKLLDVVYCSIAYIL